MSKNTFAIKPSALIVKCKDVLDRGISKWMQVM